MTLLCTRWIAGICLVAAFRVAQAAPDAPSLSLEQAVGEALRRDERMRLADSAVEDATILRKRAGTLWQPRLTGQGVITFQQESRFDVGAGMSALVQPNPEYEVGAVLSQPLYVHEYFRRKDQGHLAREQAEATLRRTREQVAIDTISAFFEVLKAVRRAELAQVAIDRAKAQVDLARARQEAGAAPKSALLQAEIDYDRFVRQKIDAQGAERVSRDLLARFTGLPVMMTLQAPAMHPFEAQDLDRAVELAQGKRSDMKAADKQVAAAQADVDATRARLYPTLNGSGSYTHLEPATVINPRTDIWRASVTLNVPLVLPASWLDISDRETAVSKAAAQRDQMRKQIRNDVTRAYVLYQTAAEQVLVTNHQRSRAEENHRLVVAQFRGGTASATDVTVAQVALAETEVTYEIARYTEQSALAEVRFAMGQLLAPK